MSSSSLANWDGSQTPKKPTETKFNGQEFRNTHTASIAVTIATPVVAHGAESSVWTTNASKSQFGKYVGDAAYGGENIHGAYKARNNVQTTAKPVDDAAPDKDVEMIDARPKLPAPKFDGHSGKTFHNGYNTDSARSAGVEKTTPIAEHAALPAAASFIAPPLSDSSRVTDIARPSTPVKSTHSSFLSPPIFASPDHRLVIPGSSRHNSPPHSGASSHYGSLFTPGPTPEPSSPTTMPPARKRQVMAYVAVPPFPPGWSKLDYKLMPRRKKDKPYFTSEDLKIIAESQKKKPFPRDEDEFTFTGSRRKPETSSPPKASKPTPKKQPPAHVAARGSTSTLIKGVNNLGQQVPPKKTKQVPRPIKPLRPKPLSEHHVPILSIAQKKTVDRMHANVFVHARFVHQEFQSRIQSRSSRQTPGLAAQQLLDETRAPCWEKWTEEEQVAQVGDWPLTIGSWIEEEELDEDVVVIDIDSEEDKKPPLPTHPTPPSHHEPTLAEVISSTVGRNIFSEHMPSSGPSTTSSMPVFPTNPHKTPRSSPGKTSPARQKSATSPSTPRKPSEKALGKQKLVETNDDATSHTPTFSPPNIASPSITMRSPQEHASDRSARQYFVNVFDSSPIRPTTHDSAFKHADSSELLLASHSGEDFSSADSPPNAGLSHSHSTTLTSSYDDILSGSGLDALDTDRWHNPIPLDQVPFGDGTINPSLLGGSLSLDDFTEPPIVMKSPSPSRSLDRPSPSSSPSRTTQTFSPSRTPSRSPSPPQSTSPQLALSQATEPPPSVDPPSPSVRPQRAHHAPSRVPRLVTQKQESDDDDDVPLSLLLGATSDPLPGKKRQSPSKKENRVKSAGPSNRSNIPDWPRQPDPDYCHQCRCKSTVLKIFCACTKKYCLRCLTKWYDEEVNAIPKNYKKFECPCCKGICTCDVCTRKRGETYTSRRPRKRREGPPGIRTKDLPQLRSTASKTPEEKNITPQTLINPPATISGSVQYFGVMYDLKGNKVGTTFSGADTTSVVLRPLGAPSPHKRRRIFIGEIQDCWGLGKDCLQEEIEPEPPMDKHSGSKRRFYIGDKRMLHKPVKSGDSETPLYRSWDTDTMGSPLTDIDDLPESAGEGKSQEHSLSMQDSDIGIVLQEDRRGEDAAPLTVQPVQS